MVSVMGSTLGTLFRITTWGESHGRGIGVVVDGCPSQIQLDINAIQNELDRRRPGQNRLTTPRDEADRVEILSGVEADITTGTPISMVVWNEDARSKSYENMRDVYRPSHADYTYDAKYGIRSWQGGGRSSARETVARVAAGAIAKQILHTCCNVECVAYVSQVHNIIANIDPSTVTTETVDASMVRCPDPSTSDAMIARIDAARTDGDSVGGVINLVVRNVPAGWGEPVFDKLKADLAKAMMSLPATMGVQFGSGFDGILMTGSEHNDSFYHDGQRIRTHTNNSGGMQGGISNGEDILVRVAFKPTATVRKEQQTVDKHGNQTTLAARGRHDPCVLPRAVPIVEAMAALVLVDHWLRHRARSISS